MKSNLWINKYKPLNINDIYGHKNEINEIINWLNNKNNVALIITGLKGIGKNITIKLILEKLNYLSYIISPNNIKNLRNNNDFSDYYNFENSIYSKIILNYQNNKIAVIFTEIENINLTNEKKFILDIYKENNKNKLFPLIFISNNQHSKLLCEFKKNCKEIVFKTLENNDCIELINKISNNENIHFDSIETIEKLIEFSQNDIRRLINLFEELSYHIKNDRIISNNLLDLFIAKSKYKNINIGLFHSTEKIINNYLDYETIYNLYDNEKVLLPLMIHENYIKNINDNINNLDIIEKISDLLSIGENIETSIYTEQYWFLQLIHGFYTCIYTSYLINKINDNNNNNNNICFSYDLNKTSLKNINKKNINNLSNFIGNKSIFEYLMLNKLCNYLLINDNYNILLNKLKYYNNNKLDIKNIELCLKIDKTYNFNLLNYKKKLMKIIQNL